MKSRCATAAEYDVDALLLDTYTDNRAGGTGKTFDWSLAVKAKEIWAADHSCRAD